MRQHCRPDAYERGTHALAAFAADANARWAELSSDGVDFEMSRSGLLVVARDSGSKGVLRHKMDAVLRGGVACRTVAADELPEIEPLLRPGFGTGLLVELDGHVRPETVSRGLAESLRRRGAEIREHTVADGFASAGADGSRRRKRSARRRVAGAGDRKRVCKDGRRCRPSGRGRPRRRSANGPVGPHAGRAASSDGRKRLLPHHRSAPPTVVPPRPHRRRHGPDACPTEMPCDASGGWNSQASTSA